LEKLPDGIFKRRNSENYYIRYWFGGKTYRESANTSDLKKAVRFRNQRISEIMGGKGPPVKFEKVTFRELTADLILDYEINGKRSMDKAKERLRLHILPFFGRMRAQAITTEQIRKYTKRRIEEGAANATINRELALVKRSYKLGAQHTPPKVALVPYIPLLKEDNARSGFFEHGDFVAMLENLPEYLKGFAIFGYKTGCRSQEIKSLEWRHVDRQNRSITIPPENDKTGKGRSLYLDDELLAIIEAQHAQRRKVGKKLSPWVFPGRNGFDQIRDLRRSWKTACEKAGIGHFLFHDLRRTAVRNMVRSGIPERVAMQISGHQTRAVFDRYNIVSEQDLKDAAEKQSVYLKGLPTARKVTPIK